MEQKIDIGDVVKLTKKNRINNAVSYETFKGIVIAKGNRKAMIRTNKNKKIVGFIAQMDKIVSSEQTIMREA